MNVTTLDVDPTVAQAKYREYREAAKETGDPMYRTLARAHRAVAQGKTLIDLPASIQKAGIDEQYRPRLAVVRADASSCYLRMQQLDGGSQAWRFGMTEQAASFWGSAAWSRRIDVEIPEQYRSPRHVFKVYEAIAPSIPPRYRPTHRLSNYHLLFEARWSTVPDPDPMLIQRVSGSLWIVLAVWDLTPIELAVLG